MNQKSGVGLALSGGGSRAIAFHYGVFEALHELKIDRKIDVVSAISGGAITGALWALYSKDWDTFCRKNDLILKEGLESPFFRPSKFLSFCLNKGMDSDELSDVLDRKIFNNIKLTEIPENILLILNATDLKTGSNFKFSKKVSGTYITGGHFLSNILLSQAVAYSAAFPFVFLPKKLQLSKEQVVYLADGGAYDSLGAHALMPDKDDNISILTQNCETIIISDASSSDYVNEENLTKSIRHGLWGSYATLTRRNKSLVYDKMFTLKKNNDIPYLGTIKMNSDHADLTSGWDKNDLNFINRYETRFKPITGKALKLLKDKGKSSAEFIITKYLGHLIK